MLILSASIWVLQKLTSGAIQKQNAGTLRIKRIQVVYAQNET